MRGRTAFLFDPTEVAGLLEGLPRLSAALPDPSQEGEPSTGFPAARKSERQIYRILSNTHYPHLDALLRTLDFCLGRGFTQPTVLRTRARSAFVPALSELHVAEHLFLRDFDVEGLDTRRDPTRCPNSSLVAAMSPLRSRCTHHANGAGLPNSLMSSER